MNPYLDRFLKLPPEERGSFAKSLDSASREALFEAWVAHPAFTPDDLSDLPREMGFDAARYLVGDARRTFSPSPRTFFVRATSGTVKLETGSRKNVRQYLDIPPEGVSIRADLAVNASLQYGKKGRTKRGAIEFFDPNKAIPSKPAEEIIEELSERISEGNTVPIEESVPAYLRAKTPTPPATYGVDPRVVEAAVKEAEERGRKEAEAEATKKAADLDLLIKEAEERGRKKAEAEAAEKAALSAIADSDLAEAAEESEAPEESEASEAPEVKRSKRGK